MERKAELREKKASLVEQMRSVLDKAEKENRNMSAEEKEQYNKIEKEFDSVEERFNTLLKQEERELSFAEKQYQKAEKEGRKADTDEVELRKEAYKHYLRQGFRNMPAELREIADKEYRAQVAGTDAAGGYTVPDDFRTVIIETMKAFGGVYGISDVQRTASGNPLLFPTNDDTANGATYLGEMVAAADATDLSFGQIALGAHVLTSGILKISNQLIQDSAIDIQNYVGKKVGERFGRTTADKLVNGTGTGQPQGFLAGASSSGVAPANNALSFENLMDAYHSIDPAYRRNLRWVFNDSTLKVLRKIKDANGQYIWQGGLDANQPGTILGVPYVIDQAMPSIGSQTKSVAIGDFSKYMVREVESIRMQRLAEKYAEFNAVGFIGFLRHDAKVMDSNAIKFIQHAL